MNKLSGMLLAVLLLAVANAWGSCTYAPATTQSVEVYACEREPCPSACQYKASCEAAFSAAANRCPPIHKFNGSFYVKPLANTSFSYFIPGQGSIFNCPSTKTNCYSYSPDGYFAVGCNYQLKCANQCDADSVVCINNGGTWMNMGASTCGGKSCKLPVCKQTDVQWLDSAKAACDALGGENNFAITEAGETCVHSGTCCTASDSIPVGNTCKWRCDSVLTQCNGRVGSLFGAVLPDTSVSGEDTTFSYQCFYNCAYSPNPDSTVYLVEGNTVLSGPNDSIADGIKSEWFSSIRSTTGSIYVYDYLSPSASEYVDSIAAMKCVEHLWRCVINNKYVYWYDNQEVPAGCTNIVRLKL